MKALLCVFSGTDHTFIASQHIKRYLEERGYQVDLYSIKRKMDEMPNPNDYDVLGLGYPIHAFNAPKIFVDFTKRLPKVDNLKTFFYKTSGEPFPMNHASSAKSWRKLKRKGYKLIMDTHLLMPYNIMFRYKDGLAKQMYLYTKAMCEVIAIKVANQEVDKVRYNPITRMWAALFRIQWFGAWINGPLYRVNKKKCIKCGLCVKECPNGNITETEKGLKFHAKCSMCMRCSFHCPTNAIRIGFLMPWRINGKYQFERLLKDENIPNIFIDDNTKGYFKLFRKYYKRADKLIDKYGVKKVH